MSAQLSLRIIGYNEALHAKRLSINKLNKHAEELEDAVERGERKLETIRVALILNKGIPKSIAKLRENIIAKVARAQRKDITIHTKEMLEKVIPLLKTELQKTCTHPFVYNRPGYEGSHLNDREDSYPGLRYCLVCGLSENSYGSRETGVLGLSKEYLFKMLIHAPDRVIESEPFQAHSSNRKEINIWVPLEAVLHPLEERVANILNS